MAIVLMALAAGSVLAASKGGPPDAKARYQRESAACASLRDFDNRANCLSEASTRYAGTRPTPAEEQADVLARNAQRRCDALPQELRSDCLARMQGQGSTRGSVAGGGIYRELVTREVVVPAGVQSAPSAPLPGPSAPSQ